MPEEVGGAGLDTLSWMLMERELGHTGYALQMLAVARPSRILLACDGPQRATYLLPTVAGERVECLAMTEPEAGSDLRGMRTRAVRDGADWVITGTKHFISHADESDFVILFAATGDQPAGDGTPRRAEITAFLVDIDTAGLTVQTGYRSVSHRGYTNSVLAFDGCRVPASAVLGAVGRGFEVANTWLGTTRLQVAASCLGRARRALELAVRYAATRSQFGRTIGRNQGVSFKLADMSTALESASWLTWRAAWLADADADATRHRRRSPDRDRDGQAARHRGSGHDRRRGPADPRRHGPDGRAGVGTDLARRPGGADLGRHLGDPATHRLASAVAGPRWLSRPTWTGCSGRAASP